jgi:hypothetical protein
MKVSCVTTKPMQCVCDQHGSRPACASTQSDQDSCCSLTNSITSGETDSEQHGPWSDCADARAGLDPCWSQTHYVGFVVTRLIYCNHEYETNEDSHRMQSHTLLAKGHLQSDTITLGWCLTDANKKKNSYISNCQTQRKVIINAFRDYLTIFLNSCHLNLHMYSNLYTIIIRFMMIILHLWLTKLNTCEI